MTFNINGIKWKLVFVNPLSYKLVDRTGVLTLGTTDPSNHTVYISDHLHDELLKRVILHELAHCVMISYALLNDIHRMIKRAYWIEAEEWMCNLIANYSEEIWTIYLKLKEGYY